MSKELRAMPMYCNLCHEIYTNGLLTCWTFLLSRRIH